MWGNQHEGDTMDRQTPHHSDTSTTPPCGALCPHPTGEQQDTLTPSSNHDARIRCLAAMSHAVRTQMNGILGTVPLLEDTGLTLAQQHLVNVIRESGTSLLGIMDAVLRDAQIDADALAVPLPATAAQPQAKPKPAHTTPPCAVPLTGMRVYVAEDNALNQEVVAMMLASLGIDTVLCQDGSELLAKLEQETAPVDAILMDCEMPVLSGYDATLQLRARRWMHSNTPVLALTAHALPEFRRRAEEAGMTDYVTKPVQRAILESRLRLVKNLHVDSTQNRYAV